MPENKTKRIRKDITINENIVVEAKEFNENFSQFLTTAAAYYLDHLRKIKFEEEMRLGYEVNAELFKEVNDDFEFADREVSDAY